MPVRFHVGGATADGVRVRRPPGSSMLVGTAFLAGARRAMRRHQGRPLDGPTISMWRLLVGEVAWGMTQLARQPTLAVALVVGLVATLLVLDEVAPGPVVSASWRVPVAVLAGWMLAAGLHQLRGRQRARAAGDAGEVRPLLGAAVVSGALVAAVLVGWAAVWVGSALA